MADLQVQIKEEPLPYFVEHPTGMEISLRMEENIENNLEYDSEIETISTFSEEDMNDFSVSDHLYSRRASKADLRKEIRRLKSEMLNKENTLKSLESDIRFKNAQIKFLEERIVRLSLTRESFENDHEKLLYLTGIRHPEFFYDLLNELGPQLSVIGAGATSLSDFQVLLLTLIKLRNNTPFRGLGYRFNTTASTAAFVFKKTIILLYHTLKPFVEWPDRKLMQEEAPPCFQNAFGNKVVVIIETCRVTLQTSSIPLKESRNEPTCIKKYMIGITPNGMISFISKRYDGRSNNRTITEKSGLLDLLLPGDVLIADDAFNFETGDFHFATPQYSQPCQSSNEIESSHVSQLIPDETVDLRPIHDLKYSQACRSHVQKMIANCSNKFKILTGTIPAAIVHNKHNGQHLLDLIVHVCYALINKSLLKVQC